MIPALAIEGLTAFAPGRGAKPMIVADLSLDIWPGELLGIVGESGSGKTTLARAAIGLIRAASGRIAVDGEVLPDLSERSFRRLRRRVALIFQNPAGSFNPRLSVKAILKEALRGLESSRTPAALLDMVGLDAGLLERFPHALSGGQARRVAVARALAADPAVIIADEPTAGLDVSAQGETMNLLTELRDRRGVAVVCITHNLPIVRHCCDRIAVMYLGRIVETGPARTMTAAPLHPYTAALLAAEPAPDPARRRTGPPVLGEVPSLYTRPAGCEFHPRCPRAAERCRTEAPTVRDLGQARTVRCHYPLEAA
ncbi:MAG TPA: ABC transporter ATP-binding protein [Alphaproteobacteria bacterium]|jgi:peptide/nickel transport system ATP-binding protein|nr:ABC transporter ATP-binding protein [Alphaproteobacteria bacterium]